MDSEGIEMDESSDDSAEARNVEAEVDRIDKCESGKDGDSPRKRHHDVEAEIYYEPELKKKVEHTEDLVRVGKEIAAGDDEQNGKSKERDDDQDVCEPKKIDERVAPEEEKAFASNRKEADSEEGSNAPGQVLPFSSAHALIAGANAQTEGYADFVPRAVFDRIVGSFAARFAGSR